MKDIIKEFTSSLQAGDLFQFWEQELALRNEIRQESKYTMSIDNTAVFDFLLRSLYYTGKRSYFLHIMFSNINNITAVNWLLKCAPEILHEFLSFVPFHIINTRPAPQQLQFIITMYKNDWQEYFRKIINVLDLEACKHLLPRTGNPDLRILIRDRQILLEQQQLNLNYGLVKTDTKQQSFSTIYGDKLSLFIKAAEKIQACSASNFNDPYGNERFSLLLDTVDIIFQTGLVEDSLAILLDVYEDYLDKNRLVDVNQEEKVYVRLNKLVRKILPLYALLTDPVRPYVFTLNFYRQCFHLLSPEVASLHYLNIYQTLLESLQGYNKHGIYEIMEKANDIKSIRPNDIFIIQEEEIKAGFSEERILWFNQAIQERLSSLPHEAFVIMEFLRLLIKEGYKLEQQITESLFTCYTELWKWVPANMFLNQQMVNELGPRLDEKNRYKAIRIVDGIKQYSLDKLLNDFNIKPDLFKKRDGIMRLQVLTAKFMGVE
ncbi:MAG: hypothetical protein ABFC94_04865 [Syntrophomonas sp.]